MKLYSAGINHNDPFMRKELAAWFYELKQQLVGPSFPRNTPLGSQRRYSSASFVLLEPVRDARTYVSSRGLGTMGRGGSSPKAGSLTYRLPTSRPLVLNRKPLRHC